MAGNWIELSGTTGHDGAALYAINMDYVTQVRFGDYYRNNASLTLIAGGDNCKATVQLSAADAELIRKWLDTHSYKGGVGS
jgi:hypothetical protein